MGKINILTKLTWGIVILTTIMVVITTLGIAYGVYFVTEKNVRDDLINDVNEAISNNLKIVDDQVVQKDQPNGQTLGVVLRAKELSALIVSTNGEILARYGIYRDLPSELLTIKPVVQGKYEDITITNYGLFDVYTAPIKAGNDVFGYLRMARQNTLIAILRSAIWAVVLVLLPLSWGFSLIFSYFLAKRITDPMTKLVRHLEKINPESMKLIVDSPKMDYEVGVVSQAINALIKRLGENLKRERQITENISHEFKTPLTRILSDLQVGKIKEAGNEVMELGGNVDALLSLAIWEKTEERCDLARIIKKQLLHVPKNLQLAVAVPKKLMIPLPYFQTQIIVRNIIENAVKHNKNSGEIKVELSSENEDNWRFAVRNNALSSSKVVERAKERKYRYGTGAGYGIGMAIVDEMCRLHSLRLEMSKENGQVWVEVNGKRDKVS